MVDKQIVKNRTNPYRIVVWGPGGLGSICIREISTNDAFELVGVRSYSASKNGVDAGTLIGIGSLGIKATTNVEELLAIECDCVLFTARDYGTYTTDEEIIQLLEAGKNIVTALPYQYLNIARSADFVSRVQQACLKGKSTFHATGVNPCLIPDRVLLALTGLSNNVTNTKLEEYWDTSNVPGETLKVCGFGAPLEIASKSPVVAAMADNFLKQGLYSWANALAVTYDRVEVEPEFGIAQETLNFDGYVVEEGTVGRLTRRWCGYVNSISDRPFMTVEVNWAMGRKMLPEKFSQATGYQGWLLSIQGRPSVRTFIDIKADLESNERFTVPGDKSTDAGYTATVATLLQAIPHVCQAAPGVMEAQATPVHWMPNLRNTGSHAKKPG